MMDVLDKTQQDMEAIEELSWKYKAHDVKDAEETGYCLYCGEPVKEGRRWCDKECARLWEYEQLRKKRNGRT